MILLITNSGSIVATKRTAMLKEPLKVSNELISRPGFGCTEGPGLIFSHKKQ